jgi:hypothetical protein
MMKFSLPSTFIIPRSVFDSAEPLGRELEAERLVAGCGSLFSDT